MHSVKGQDGGGAGLLFFRSFKAMCADWLPNGNCKVKYQEDTRFTMEILKPISLFNGTDAAFNRKGC
jgi:hypothetical protein